MIGKFLKWGIYAIVFSVPLYLIRFEVFGIPTTVLEIMIYILFVAWLIKGFNFFELKEGIKENRLLFWAIFLILFGASLATLRSWDLRLSAGILKAWFFDPLLFFIVFTSVVKSLKEIKGVLYGFVFSGLVVSVASLVYLFFGKLNVDGRLQGPYNSPNYLAMYLAPILVIGLGLLAYGHKKSSAGACLPLAGGVFLTNNLCLFSLIFGSSLMVLILFCTGSFGAWMGIVGAIGFGLTFWFLGAKKKKIAVILVILLVVLCIGLYFLKFSSIQGKLSINSRLEIWQRAIDAITIYPVIGIGPGTFKDLFPAYPFWSVPQPHNLYLAFLLQTGIVGFVGFVLLLAWFFKTALSLLKTDYSLLIASAMLCILIHGLVDTTYWKNDLTVVFWAIIGIMIVLKTEVFRN